MVHGTSNLSPIEGYDGKCREKLPKRSEYSSIVTIGINEVCVYYLKALTDYNFCYES